MRYDLKSEILAMKYEGTEAVNNIVDILIGLGLEVTDRNKELVKDKINAVPDFTPYVIRIGDDVLAMTKYRFELLFTPRALESGWLKYFIRNAECNANVQILVEGSTATVLCGDDKIAYLELSKGWISPAPKSLISGHLLSDTRYSIVKNWFGKSFPGIVKEVELWV